MKIRALERERCSSALEWVRSTLDSSRWPSIRLSSWAGTGGRPTVESKAEAAKRHNRSSIFPGPNCVGWPVILRLASSASEAPKPTRSGTTFPTLGRPLPPDFDRTLTGAQWNAAADFSRELGFELFFTLNAGPGPRDGAGAWTATNAETLVAHAARRGDPVGVWELGNEVNAFQVIHGLTFKVSAAQYARDVQKARRMVDRLHPEALLAGPSSAYWPEIGEVPLLYERFMEIGGQTLDIITWHYYPQQSRRCPLRVRPAGIDLMHDPNTLDEIQTWASLVESVRDQHAAGRPVWLGETGNAQCGGEPGLSDRFASGFWWLDQLAQMARRGQPVVVRQSLTGASYGLIEEPSLEPRPDFFVSVLWKRLMGTTVLDSAVAGDRRLRAYAHCTPGGSGAVTMVTINMDRDRGAFLRLQGTPSERIRAYRLTSLDGGIGVALNGMRLGVQPDGTLPALEGEAERLDPQGPELWTPAGSFGFFVLEDADHPDCRN